MFLQVATASFATVMMPQIEPRYRRRESVSTSCRVIVSQVEMS